MKLGILLWSQGTDWPRFRDAARRMEDLGYDYLWTWDHVYAIFGDPYQPIFEGWTALAGLAASTERLRLGLMVGANTFRNPALVAKMAATVDAISDGRSMVGLGAAWFALEHEADGYDFGAGVGQRCDWLDESAGIVRRLLDGESVTYSSEKYRLENAIHHPRPVQAHLPMVIGGSGEKKTLRTVAKYADIWNGIGSVETLAAKSRTLDEHCAAVGRDPAAIERSLDCFMVIRDRESDAREAWLSSLAYNKTDPSRPAAPLLGPPAAIAETLRAYRDLGFRTVNVELPAPYDAETLERLVHEVKPLVERPG
ncbi:MAG TPA: TIGR03560 family F420-dependent LLM class oxidoreductase [Candidatus Dormibacteraeota bacterium]|nr:TIGR03560 family F420-dependent LLM class oxidoreductase [Candidatus Dormibacteraeota bacterium]